jgi:hypothetical protein
MEEWREIKGYESIYQVSNLGRVKSLKYGKERIMKSSIEGNGYLQLILCKDRKVSARKIHRLVAESFLNHNPCAHKLVVNHKDFNRTNNNLSNLEIISQRENSNKKHLKSSSRFTGVYWHKYSNKWRSSIMINKKQEHLGYFKSEFRAHLAYQSRLIELANA